MAIQGASRDKDKLMRRTGQYSGSCPASIPCDETLPTSPKNPDFMAHFFYRWMRGCLVLSGAVCLATLCGCSQQAEIRHYTVPRTTATSSGDRESDSATVSRMLAAIVPHGKTAWFFKATGPDTAVDASLDDFLAFLKSVRFGEQDDAKPSWTLPEGWKQLPGSEFRFATIQIESALAPFELTVIPLPMEDGFNDDLILSNVNRWREQMQLSAITKEKLDKETTKLEISDGHPAVYVNLVGNFKTNTMGRPPFAGGTGPFAGNEPSRKPPVKKNEPTADSEDLTFAAPAGWEKGPGNAFSRAAFKVTDGDQAADITITAAGGDLLQNINRWRGQLKLDPWDKNELEKEVKPIKLGDDVAGSYVAITSPENASPRETILGVIANHDGATWFIKLKGPAALAEREKDKFEAFVKSIRFK